MSSITEDEYREALGKVAEFEAKRAEQVAAQRAAYAIPVKALVESDDYRSVFGALHDMLGTQTDDSYFGIPVGSLHTIMRNLARQVGVELETATTGQAA